MNTHTAKSLHLLLSPSPQCLLTGVCSGSPYHSSSSWAYSVLYATLSAHQELDTSLPQGLLYPIEGHPDHFLLNALSVGTQAGRMIGDSLGNGASYWVRENPP